MANALHNQILASLSFLTYHDVVSQVNSSVQPDPS